MPNRLRNTLNSLGFFCDKNLSSQEVHDTANLHLAVNNAATMLRELSAGKEATELCSKWAKVCEWEDEIETLDFIRQATDTASQSWARCVNELRDLALTLAESKQIAAAEGRKFAMADASSDSSPVPINSADRLVINDDPTNPYIEWQGKQFRGLQDGTCEAFQTMYAAKGKAVGIGGGKVVQKASRWHNKLPEELQAIVRRDKNKGYYLTIFSPPDNV